MKTNVCGSGTQTALQNVMFIYVMFHVCEIPPFNQIQVFY